MSSLPNKLVLICFQKTVLSGDSFLGAVDSFEQLYIYGLLCQFLRLSNLQYKDKALVQDKITLDNALKDPDVLKKQCYQICYASRSRYLLTGRIVEVVSAKDCISVQVMLYDANTDRFLIEDELFENFLLQYMPSRNKLVLGWDELNWLINNTFTKCVRSIEQHVPLPDDYQLAGNVCKSFQSLQLLLKAYLTVKNSTKVQFYEQALREDYALDIAYYSLAKLYKGFRNYEKSILYFKETLKCSLSSDRNKSIIATEAGIVCTLMSKTELALKWWLRAIEYDKFYIMPYLNVANLYEDQDNLVAAEEYFCKAKELSPEDFRVISNLARLYSKMGVWDKALEQYLRQLKTESTDPWCYSDIAMCYLNLGNPENAREYFQKSVEMDPDGDAGQYAQLVLQGVESRT